MGSSFPKKGEHKKHIWNHQLDHSDQPTTTIWHPKISPSSPCAKVAVLIIDGSIVIASQTS